MMRLCVVEICAGVASASPGVCCSSSHSLKQSEDLPIKIKVTHEKLVLVLVVELQLVGC